MPFPLTCVRGLRVCILQQILDLSRLGSGEPVEGVLPFSSVAQPPEAPLVASSSSQGVASGLSQGFGCASGWLDDSVNASASSSAASASAPRV